MCGLAYFHTFFLTFNPQLLFDQNSSTHPSQLALKMVKTLNVTEVYLLLTFSK